MHRVIAISNRKGGVGKTTSAINIAAGLGRLGHRVVLVDLDPQVNASRGQGVTGAEVTIHGALLGEHALKAHATRTPNLALVAGSEALSGLEQLTSGVPDREYLLRTLLAPWQNRCEFVVLDCPPSLDLLTVNAYACATELYIPLEGQLYAADGVSKVLELVERIRQRLNPQLQVKGIFFTRFDKRKVLRRETAEELHSQYPDLVLAIVIRESIALGEAPHLGQDILAIGRKARERWITRLWCRKFWPANAPTNDGQVIQTTANAAPASGIGAGCGTGFSGPAQPVSRSTNRPAGE